MAPSMTLPQPESDYIYMENVDSFKVDFDNLKLLGPRISREIRFVIIS